MLFSYDQLSHMLKTIEISVLIQQILERKAKQKMGQQCSSNSTAQSYELARKGQGIKLKGNGESLNSPRKTSVYHFQKSTVSSQLNPGISRIQSLLGNFHHSKSFNPPKGTVEPLSYTLNEEGLIYKQNGQWKNGMPHGRGELLYPDGSYYVGYIENGVPHGEGRFISIDGWYYEGELKNQQAEGRGKFVFQKNGLSYQGNWAADLPDGFGKETWKRSNGTIVYEGHFLNGVKHGNGKYTTPDFNYDGCFQDNMLNGKGRIVYKNGQIYEGDFLNGKKHGHGTYRWPDHSEFQGLYENDKKHGIGKYTNSNGKVFEGKWINGKRQGQGVVIVKNKQHYYDWKNNEASPEKKKI